MTKETVSFKETQAFSKLMLDYIAQEEALKSFYGQYPTRENFLKQAELKSQSYQNRTVLYECLVKQYEGFKIHQNVSKNLHALKEENTFTITTGHQLNLFTGPLYFIYKIVCVINLAEEMNRFSSDKKFVPVYWMATEDHDFEEINHFNYKEKVIRWNSDQTGAVGRFDLKGMNEVFKTLEIILPNSKKKTYLLSLFRETYLETNSLAYATRILVNELFEEYGLIIIDGDDPKLKTLFKPYVQEELVQQTAFNKVSKSIDDLRALGYKIQVNPREINLFYLFKGGRERIIFEDNEFIINNTSLRFSKEELLTELDQNPQNFSPNVLLRPLYQEVILPNVAYIGGGGEIAYWLELKSFFNSQKIPFPILKLRNSVLVLGKSVREKIIKKNLTLQDIFSSPALLFEDLVRKNTEIDLSFERYFKVFEDEFSQLKTIAKETDKSFLSAVEAHEAKVSKSIRILEKRLLKAEKRKFEEQKESIENLYFKIHPKGKIQERVVNFSEIIIDTDITFIKEVKTHLNPFEDEFVILTF
ncbi:putative cysteine ligase BshC [Flavobacteriaceae bacterium UJ101]|nr:putative cysteine ligase BshC [Flavobacteriaceae bacterium UJ101]